MNRAVIRALREAGVDTLTALEASMIQRPDDEHLAYATSQARVFCTFNVGDFYRLHTEHVRAGRRHAGILLIPQQRFSPGDLTRRVRRLVATLSAESIENRAEFLSSWEPV